LRAAIEELDEEDRQILVLRKLLDVPPSVVATELGLAESTIRWRLARTLAELAARLG
jgi:RNA polymerase sigma factor (sigma-70 family)